MKRLLFITVIATLILAGCTNDNTDESAPVKPFKREWYRIVNTDTLSIDKITKEMSGISIPFGFSPLVRTSFLYHSLNGSDTLTLSGAVCWPLETDGCSEIWLESHYFSTRWNECPSQQAEPGMLITSMRKGIYIGADYQGLGLSRDLDSPYLNTVMLANQNIDCFKAGMTIIKDSGPGLTDDFKTFNIGYSLGGAVAMGIAKQMELDADLKEYTHFRRTFCGGGPYDQVAYFNHYLEESPTLELAYPIAFLCAIRSITNSSPSFTQKHSYEECFSETLLNSGIIEAVDSKNYTTNSINVMMQQAGCTSISTILSPELLDRDSQLNKDILRELEKLDLTTGWTPRSPILIQHSRTDTFVPFACMESAMANLSGYPNVTFEVVDQNDHQGDGIRFYINIAFNYPID